MLFYCCFFAKISFLYYTLCMEEKINFFESVYEVVNKIPKGKVATYGQIAKILGKPRMARQVGWALHVNPQPNITPCHRVVNRFGQLSPAFAFGGLNQQKVLLQQEGVLLNEQDRVDLSIYLWDCL